MHGLMDSDHLNHKSTQTILDGQFTIQESKDGRTFLFAHSKDASHAYDAYTGENNHGATGQIEMLSLIHISEPTRPY